jgi:hypothetical protein
LIARFEDAAVEALGVYVLVDMRDNFFLLVCWGLSTQSVNWAAAFKIVQIIMSTSVIPWWMPPFIALPEKFGIFLTNLSKSLHLGSEMIISRQPVEAL